ncbi:MAG: thiamine pyrophosphate-dependent dehydrogenase E1 component subunit alpha [Candidatus Latescibacteria bacterium]|nr:thiamine pyrophosphate-dependent dehydrogenase E1 component subunit alpha [Candidatus Latescibacterota bacterium]
MASDELDGLSTEHLRGLYRKLVLLRRFEDRVYHLFLQGELAGTLHQYQGQEAVAVGVCDQLLHTDWITSTHRPHGHALAKGVSSRAAMAELYGKETGCCRGKGGSMHFGDPEVGMLPAIAIVGGGNTVVTGLGLAFKLRQSSQVAVCFFGDGATNEGAFHEGLNFAAVQQLPVVFVCENNLYGASTPYHQVSPVVDVAERAAAYRMPTQIVDGMDVLAVRRVAGEAVAAARSGQGPSLIECKTYRFTGHSRSDARGYRTKVEEAEWLARDPIPCLGQVLVAAGRLSEVELAAVEEEVSAELDEAVAFSRQSPDPTPAQAYEDVWI